MQQELSLETTRALAMRVAKRHMVCSYHECTNLTHNHFRFPQTQTNFLLSFTQACLLETAAVKETRVCLHGYVDLFCIVLV
jgi:hypothetical protein